MEAIQMDKVQEKLDQYKHKPVYIHIETTNGAYASHFDKKAHNVGAYVRNAQVTYKQAKIVESDNIYRVGLKLDLGWIYAEGVTDWTIHGNNELLLAGHDEEGRLMVSLQISETPFRN